MNRRLILIAGLVFLSGCATATKSLAPSASPSAELEPLYGATAGREALTISVASNGCTKKEDFAFFVERRGETVTLAFGRKRLDPCRSFVAARAELVFTYAELGLAANAPVFLANPFAAWTGPGS
jgi:hypothetical protein